MDEHDRPPRAHQVRRYGITREKVLEALKQECAAISRVTSRILKALMKR